VNCTEPEFWNQRYRANKTPWDLHGVPAALLDYLQRTPAKGTALVPGCGSGYEVRTFLEHGWQALAIDFSPAAVERARTVLGGDASTVRLADFFADELGGPFDLVYERTFLCSFPPERWPVYARRIAEVLKPGGRLIGVFAFGDEPDPPPFLLGNGAAASLLGSNFILVEDHPIPPDQSLPLFAGKERWQVWQRRTGEAAGPGKIAAKDPDAER
jgi:thiopurine S-methyltransferase